MSPPTSQPRASASIQDRRIAQVRVDETCILCGACMLNCPSVFNENTDSAFVLSDAWRLYDDLRVEIEEAAEGCPVEAIKIEYRAVSVQAESAAPPSAH